MTVCLAHSYIDLKMSHCMRYVKAGTTFSARSTYVAAAMRAGKKCNNGSGRAAISVNHAILAAAAAGALLRSSLLLSAAINYAAGTKFHGYKTKRPRTQRAFCFPLSPSLRPCSQSPIRSSAVVATFSWQPGKDVSFLPLLIL
jgi:hypothetical protein